MCNTAHNTCSDLADEYLLLHRENYLDDGPDTRRRIRQRATRTTEADIIRLLSACDWRDRLVGVYLAFNLQTVDLRHAVADMLLSAAGRPVRRAICLGLALLQGEAAAGAVCAFLTGAYREDSLHEYAAAFESARALGLNLPPEIEKGILRQLLAEGFTLTTIEQSRSRFRKAIQYWREEWHQVLPTALTPYAAPEL